MEKMFFIIDKRMNWSDEISFDGITVMSEKILKKLKDVAKKLDDDFCEEHGIGSNEDIIVTKRNIVKSLDSAKEISTEEFEMLKNLGIIEDYFSSNKDFYEGSFSSYAGALVYLIEDECVPGVEIKVELE